MEINNTSEAMNFMRVQPVEHSFDFDVNNNIYVVRADRELTFQRYLGLYKDKSVMSVGTIVARITAIKTEDDIEYEVKFGKLTGKRIKLIESFLDNHHLENDKHLFFFVDKFYDTDFKKTSPGGLQGSKIFNLTDYLEEIDNLNAETLAEQLRNKTWM